MPTTTLSEPGLTAVVDLARERLADGISVTDLADHAGYSPFHFTRLFTATMGVGPGAYLTALRMDAAKRLLLAGDDAVIDIATEVGFDSLSSFSRRFRATVGVPPAALRRLADRIADRPPRPSRLVPEGGPWVDVDVVVPDHLLPRGDLSVWVGWYPQPAPIGVPRGGVLIELGDPLRIPLSPGAPWLLGFAVETSADPAQHLAPAAPMVAAHRAPVTGPGRVTLHVGQPGSTSVPLLTALPSLCRGR